ncbi:MAG TPA: hypothetical protein PKE07_10495 [Lacibacter sp.]|nr:hypothetical protein [Lacibacter sp.]HMO89248.1 hypothetical protein [Lacibacter sp.]
MQNLDVKGASVYRWLAVAQVLFFAFMLAVNGMANGLPLNGYTTGAVSALYPNRFVPAGFTFSIWGVIYLLLLGYTAFSSWWLWGADLTSIAVSRARSLAPLYLLTCLLNAGWIVAWHFLQPVLSLLLMLTFLLTLLLIYRVNGEALPGIAAPARWWLRIPFVVYLGWISVATIANTTAVLVHLEWNGWGLSPETWSCTMVAVAALLGGWMGWRGEVAFSGVVIWALFGIARGQADAAPVVTAAWTGMAGCFLLAAAGWWRSRNKQT